MYVASDAPSRWSVVIPAKAESSLAHDAEFGALNRVFESLSGSTELAEARTAEGYAERRHDKNCVSSVIKYD